MPPPHPTLHLDAASPTIHVGLGAAPEAEIVWRTTADEAGVGLFREVDALLRKTGLRIRDVGAVVFCEGPGSLLGIRIAAMALRTWAALPRELPLEVTAYRSLELAAAQRIEAGETGPFHVITDARRGTWNLLTVDAAGHMSAITRWPGDLPLPAARAVFAPEGFPVWQALPAGTRAVAYRPQDLPGLAQRHTLLRHRESPDAFLTEAPTYRVWTPGVAGGPAATVS